MRVVCESRPEFTFTVYESLVGYSTKFDRLTKSKTIEGLYSLIPAGDLSHLFQFLQSQFLLSDNKKWFADQILIVFRQHTTTLQQHAQLILAVSEFLCRYAFFKSELNDADQSILREKIFSILSILVSDSSEVWASKLVLLLEHLKDQHKRVVKLDSQIKKLQKAAVKNMKSVRKLV
jgi:DNA polymerase phi